MQGWPGGGGRKLQIRTEGLSTEGRRQSGADGSINSAAAASFSTIFPSTLEYFEILNTIVQEEPIDAVARGSWLHERDRDRKGKPFDPDPRMKKLLTEAATLGNAAGRSITYDPRISGVKIYPDSKSNWMMGYANKNTSFEADGSMNLDARVLFYYNAGGVTPAMAVTHPGAGSDYALGMLDSNNQPFDGSKTYKLHLPPNVPVNNFWAVTLYDTQTRSTTANQPTIPNGWQRDQGNGAERRWVLRRLLRAGGARRQARQLAADRPRQELVRHPAHGPLEPWINKTWRPGEIELVD